MMFFFFQAEDGIRDDLVTGVQTCAPICMVANDTQAGTTYAVPWFGGVRAVWYRTDQFKKAGITSTPTTWAELQADAVKLQSAYPGTTGFDAITNDTNAFASFVWGAGGQIATQDSSGKWTGNLTDA